LEKRLKGGKEMGYGIKQEENTKIRRRWGKEEGELK
jgi:hypothetical protein